MNVDEGDEQMKPIVRTITSAATALCVVLGVIVLSCTLIPQVLASSLQEPKLVVLGTDSGMSVSPSSTLFTITDIYPGKKEAETLRITNDGKTAFHNTVTVRKESGDDLLYEVLDLAIYNQDESPLYSGKLHKVRNLDLGTVASGGFNDLRFEVELPLECGNEYQNLKTKVVFELVGTQHPPVPPSGGGSRKTPQSTGAEPQSLTVPDPEPVSEPRAEDEGVVVEEETPGAPQLPKTGEIPPVFFYGTGLVLVLIGLGLSFGRR